MSDDRVTALALALKAVLNVARRKGLNLHGLSEAAADELSHYSVYDAKHVSMAICEIKVAAHALV